MPPNPKESATMSAASPSVPAWKLKFERKGLNVNVTVVDAKKAEAERAREAAAEKLLVLKERQEGRFGPMQAQLADLLSRHPEAPAVLKHLAVFERALRKKGETVFGEAPVELLQGALRQLEVLVTDWSARGLAELRSRLAVAVIERGGQIDGGHKAALGSNRLDDDDQPEVSEATPTDFAHAEALCTPQPFKPA